MEELGALENAVSLDKGSRGITGSQPLGGLETIASSCETTGAMSPGGGPATVSFMFAVMFS